MRSNTTRDIILLASLLYLVLPACGPQPVQPTNNPAIDPLPSWNAGATKQSIIDFVRAVTQEGGTSYVAPERRIATFDNDGTLWSEQPFYVQYGPFVLDRIKALAPEHTEWKTQQPFKAALEGDKKSLAAAGMKGLSQLGMAAHAGMTTAEFEHITADWIATAKHPRFDRRYNELVYQPMLELLDYLRANGFKTFIVSGGGIDFMRVWAEDVYGVPPEQVIGTSIKTTFKMRDGEPVLLRQPKMDFMDDGEGKPVAIDRFIGRRPIAAFGNSDGDLQMLQWTAAGHGLRLMVLVHHTDADREWAYDRNSLAGKLDKGLDEAETRGWTVVDMKTDWSVIYPFEMSMDSGQ